MGKITKAILASEDFDVLIKLISTGENVEELDKDGRTPLLHATIDNRIDIVRVLLESGANVNIQDKFGYSPLHYAAQNYYVELVRLLINFNAQVDSKDIHGNTPLFKAVFNSKGQGEAIKILIEHGADKELTNNHGVSPYQLAKTIANYNIVHFME